MKALLAIGIFWCGFAQANVSSTFEMRTDVEDEAQIVQVAAELKAQDGKSRMDQVIDWYNAGQDVTYAEVKGTYVGRCFSFDDPNKGKNNLFATMGVNDGPGFPEQPKFLANITYNNGRPADKYDHVEKASEVSRFFAESYNDSVKNYYGSVEENPLRQLGDLEANGRMDFDHRYRKSGDYLVLVVTNLISQKLFVNIMTHSKYANAGDVIFTCYFFKKLAE